MRLAIDCRMSGKSGIGAFLDNTLPFLIGRVAEKNEEVENAAEKNFSCEKKFLEEKKSASENDRKKNCVLLLGLPQKKWSEFLLKKIAGLENCELLPCSIKTFSAKEMFFFPRGLLKKINSCDAYFSPYCNIPGRIFSKIKIPIFTTIHDVVFLDLKLAGAAGTFLRKLIYKRALKKSAEIFTVSNFSKERIQKKLRCKKKISVVYNGAPLFEGDAKSAKKNPPQKANRILFVGNIKKHKGLLILISAFKKFRGEMQERGLPLPELLIVGSKENFRTKDADFEKMIFGSEKSGVKFTGYVSDEKLKTLFSSSKVLAQPSLYEGFGIPPLQALYAGTRAVVSDIPVFREIYKSLPVTFFSAENENDLKEKLCEAYLSDEALPNFERIYSYEKTAKKIFERLLQCEKS